MPGTQNLATEDGWKERLGRLEAELKEEREKRHAFHDAYQGQINVNNNQRDRVAGLEAEVERLRKECAVYKDHAEYWRQQKLEDGLNPALMHLAMEYLPDWAWFDLGLASTTYLWWKRLRDLLEKGPPELEAENERLRAEVAELRGTYGAWVAGTGERG